MPSGSSNVEVSPVDGVVDGGVVDGVVAGVGDWVKVMLVMDALGLGIAAWLYEPVQEAGE